MGLEPTTNELKVRCSPLSFHPVLFSLTSISIAHTALRVKPKK